MTDTWGPITSTPLAELRALQRRLAELVCPRCHGFGGVEVPTRGYGGTTAITAITCPACGGTGLGTTTPVREEPR